MTADNEHPGHVAASLGVSRAIARDLLAIPRDLRGEVLAEVLRIGVGRTLALARTQPTLTA